MQFNTTNRRSRLRPRLWKAGLTLSSLLVLAACEEVSAPPEIASVEVTAAKTEFVVGESFDFDAVPKSPTGQALTGRTVSWTSDNPEIASITADGLLEARRSGSATLTATSEARSSRVFVRVRELAPAPLIRAIEPSIVRADDLPPFVLTVYGDGFTETSRIRVGRFLRATEFVSRTELRTDVTSTDIEGESPEIRVETPAPGGGISAPTVLTSIQPAPVITSLEPSRVQSGGGRTIMAHIEGSGFTPATWLWVNGIPRGITTQTRTTISFPLFADELNEVRQLSIRLENPSPGGGKAISSVSVEPTSVASIDILTPPEAAWTWARLGLPLSAQARSVNGEILPDQLIGWRNDGPNSFSFALSLPNAVRLLSVTPGVSTVSATAAGIERSIDVQVYDAPVFDVVYSAGTRGDRYIARWDVSGNTFPRRLDLGVQALQPAPSPDGRQLAFIGLRDGMYDELYVANADGTNVRRLTRNDFAELHPVWSPDGARIAFVSTRTGSLNVFTVRPDGTDVQQLTFATLADPAAGSGNAAVRPSWSPDGQRIVYSVGVNGRWQLWIMNADGAGKRRLTAPVNADDYEATWSPDGRTIAFRRVQRSDNRVSLMRVDVVTGIELSSQSLAQVTNAEQPQYSPDGNWLMMMGTPDPDPRALFAVPAREINQRLPRVVLSASVGGHILDARWIRR